MKTNVKINKNETDSSLSTTVQKIVNDRIKASGSARSFDGQAFIASIVKQTLETLMKAELQEHLEDCKESKDANSKNGYDEKRIRGDFGELDITVPRDRNASFEPTIVPKRQKELGNFSEKVVSLYARGMTTREIEEHLSEMYNIEVSPQYISMATNQIKEQLEEWRSRPLDEVYPIVYLDGTFIAVRDQETNTVMKKCLYVVLGINIEGKLDVLSLEIENTEGAKFWLQVLTKLKKRGVEDILIACADGLKGFDGALEAVFPKTELQLCVVHHIRNVTKFIKHSDKKSFCTDMKKIYCADDIQAAEFALEQLDQKWGKKYPAAIQAWKDKWTSLTTFFRYPVELRKIIYTTNRIENLNSIIKKNINNRRQFRNDDSLLKIVFLNVRNISHKWSPIQNWSNIYNQLVLLFGDRITNFSNI